MKKKHTSLVQRHRVQPLQDLVPDMMSTPSLVGAEFIKDKVNTQVEKKYCIANNENLKDKETFYLIVINEHFICTEI